MPDAAPPEDRRFRASFARLARRVRTELMIGRVLTGAALGLLVGAAAATGAWKLRHGALRPWTAGAGLLGAALGYAAARRRSWDDESVALYLDGKLGSHEVITTALDFGDRDDDAGDAGRAVVISEACAALATATPKRVRPPIWRAIHAAVPVAAGIIAAVSVLPLPPAAAATLPPPGSESITVAQLKGLEKVILLEQLDARDEAQKERLRALADDAKKLREKLRNGVEKREAQSDIAKLRDGITSERLSLGDGEERQGLESALGKMGENSDLKDAAKALGDRDLTQFDEEMAKLANKLEKQDREKAKQTLEEAAAAAKKAGAKDVAKALEAQKQRLDERGKKHDRLKELAKALGEGLSKDEKKALQDAAGNSGDPKASQKLADRLEDALGKLSPEERKRVAEAMKKRAEQMSDGDAPGGLSKKDLRDMAKELESPEGQKQLEDELKKMAEDPGPESDESKRQKALEDAQKGAGESEAELGGGVPMPMPGSGDPGGKAGGDHGGNDPKGQAQAGHTEGGGAGDHKGQTNALDAPDLRAKADAKINHAAPMPGTVMGRTTGRAGETANTRGAGALGVVGPEEVGGIERSDVPEEYREQVGRYFQPQ